MGHLTVTGPDSGDKHDARSIRRRRRLRRGNFDVAQNENTGTFIAVIMFFMSAAYVLLALKSFNDQRTVFGDTGLYMRPEEVLYLKGHPDLVREAPGEIWRKNDRPEGAGQWLYKSLALERVTFRD